MYSSAMRSSSIIEMPGSSRSCISASVPTTTSPARAISSISCADLRMIIACASEPRLPRSGSRPRPHMVERLLDLHPHLGRAAGSVQRDELARRAVVLDDRRGPGVVDVEAVRDRLRRVVGAVLL